MHLLLEAKPDLVVLAGYLKILDKEIVNAFLGRIVNIHPSLLPKYGGKGCYGLKVHEMVLESGDTVTGATIHYVTEGVDQGEIILQHQMGVEKTDTPESLASRVLDLEHQLMVEGVKKVLMEMDGRSEKWEDC
jgi:phosphoribosylglycinamide formyltransferase-1